MALWYFRKHRKFFLVLMIMAVFGMLTWGAVSYAPDALKLVKKWTTGVDPDNPPVVTVYGEPVTRYDWWQVRRNLDASSQMALLVSQWGRSRQPERVRMANAINLSISEIQRPYIMTHPMFMEDAEQRDREQTRLTNATVALLQEAKRYGIEVTDGAAANHIRDWAKAGVTDADFARLLQVTYEGYPLQAAVRELYSTIRQNLALTVYLRAVADGGIKPMEADVLLAFRRQYQNAEVLTVKLKVADYLDQVDPPTEAAIDEQFEQYKDQLPGEDDAVYGYMIPDRVAFKYLKIDAEAVRPTVSVSEDEVLAFYEENKDVRYVIDESETGMEDLATPSDAIDDSAAGSAIDDTGAATEPARVLDAPEDVASDAISDEQAAEMVTRPGAEPPSDALADPPGLEDLAPMTGLQDINTDTGDAAAPPAAEQGEPKQYKPLDEVRDKIIEELTDRKIMEQVSQIAAETVDRLRANSRLKLENVADPGGKTVKVLRKGLVTREEAAEVPGIGAAFLLTSAQGHRWMSFADFAFSNSELVENKPAIYVGRPSDPLVNTDTNDQYIFVITEVDPAHQPASVDEVRQQVVDDLRHMAAYDLAVADAKAIIEAARDGSLKESVEARELTTEERRLSRSQSEPHPLLDLPPDPLAKEVYAVVDDGRRLGYQGDVSDDAVTVFEVLEVEPLDAGQYTAMRQAILFETLRTRRQAFMDAFLDADAVLARSGFKLTGNPLRPGEEDEEDADAPAAPSTPDPTGL